MEWRLYRYIASVFVRRYAVVVSETSDHNKTGGRLRCGERAADEDDDWVVQVAVDDGRRVHVPARTATTPPRPSAALSLHQPQRQRTKNDGTTNRIRSTNRDSFPTCVSLDQGCLVKSWVLHFIPQPNHTELVIWGRANSLSFSFVLNTISKTYQLPLEILTTDCLDQARSLLYILLYSASATSC